MGSLDFGAAAAAIVVVVDEVVEVVDVLEVELVVVDRCVVVVLRCVVVVCGACVVVGTGAAVVVGATVVVVVGVSVVVVVVSSAPAVPSPNAKVPIINASAATARAAIEARRGADGRITSLTLDRRCLLAWSVIRLGGRLPLMLRAGIGRSTADGAAQQHRAISRAGAATMSRILKIAHM